MRRTRDVRPRIATVGGELHAVAHAPDLGIDVVAVHVRGKYDPRMASFCERLIDVPTLLDDEHVLEVLAPLHAERPFTQVLTTSEFGGVTAAKVNAVFGTPGNSVDAAMAMKDKQRMRELLDKAGVSPVRYGVVSSAEDVRDFLRDVGGSIVVKPIDGTASAHVRRIDDVAGVGAAWSAYLESGHTQALAEEFLVGPVGSVETFSANGRHLPVTVTEYYMNDRFVETGAVVPSRVAGARAHEMKAMTVQLLDAVGITDGPSHSEFVLTPDGPRVLESHNRLGGGGMAELVRRACGVNLSRMFLSVPLGLEALPATLAPTAGAAIRFFNPAPGVVRRVHGLDRVEGRVVQVPPGTRVAGTPGLEAFTGHDVGVMILVNDGDVVPPLDAGWNRSVGYVIASGATGDEAAATCERVLAAIEIETTPVSE
ncbi:ATP-grasp domain-containing protein [Salinispora arenicola]|uniref:ATP-grasp domain-containing protein n=1 Tax=Salinispora arenicola TaxID=168697 RepID=UPI00035C21B7|nr:ATP-grasp domain-containing protein [Salinispora arenicola]